MDEHLIQLDLDDKFQLWELQQEAESDLRGLGRTSNYARNSEEENNNE